MRNFLAILVILYSATLAHAQKADLIVTNAKIVTLDATSGIAQALAVREGRIVAVGNNDAMEALVGPATRRVDVGGRTVIPGLINSHIHAVRAGLTYATEVNWIGAKTIAEAMERVAPAVKARPSSWIIVAGGWSELQFAEKRRPTLAEVTSAVPDNPAYIQLFYSAVLMTPRAQQALGILPDQLPAGITGLHLRSHRLVQRLHRQHLGPVRPPAAAEFRGKRRRNPAVLHRAKSPWHYRRGGSRRFQHLSQPLRGLAETLA